MKKSVIGSALVLGLAVAVAGPSLGGCGSTQGGSSGTGGTQAPGEGALGKISTQLTLPGGETIASVNWTISQGATTVLTGTYAVPAAATTIPFFIPNVPAGSGYTITLSAGNGVGTCAAGEVQICSSAADCPAGKQCIAGKWKIFQVGFCM